MTLHQTRSVVRNTGRESRAALRGNERVGAERALIAHLQSLRALEAPSVGLFIAHDGEPDLQPLIDWLWHAGTVVALPVLRDDPDDFTMRFVAWSKGDRLVRGRYGIPVPANSPATGSPATGSPAAGIEPVTLLVSLTGFDSAGNRIGRGGGFFDRYLARRASNADTGSVIGIGFECQRFDRVPVEPHDVALQTIVTDLGVRYFS